MKNSSNLPKQKVSILGLVVIENQRLNFTQILTLVIIVFLFVLELAVLMKFYVMPVIGGGVFMKLIFTIVKMVRERGP